MYVLLTSRVAWPETRQRAGEMGLRVALGLAGLAALPLALKLGPKEWFVLGDKLLLHSTTVISEGRPWLESMDVAHAAREFWTYTGRARRWPCRSRFAC